MIGKGLKYLAWALGGLAGVAVLALAAVWVVSEQKLNQHFEMPDIEIAQNADPAILAEGQRLAAIAGCSGCHGERMQGEIVTEAPDGTRLVAPNIPRIAAEYTDRDMAKLIRFGVKKNGRPVVMMPSEAFFSMTDSDLTAILSYIRTAHDEGGDLPNTRIGPLVRLMLATDKVETAPARIVDMAKRPVYNFNNNIERGAYLATIACAECHGLDFKGVQFGPDFAPPDLIVASAYLPEEFATLMKTGAATGGRELGLMSEVSRRRLSQLTDKEIEAIHAFLQHRAMRPQ